MDPVTAITIASTAFSMVSQVMGNRQAGAQAHAQAAQAEQAAQVSEYNARVAEINALNERQFAVAEMDRMRQEARRREGAARARAGASGVEVDRGSLLDVLSDEAISSELDTLLVGVPRETRARAAEAQAAGFRMQGQGHLMQASQARASASARSSPLSVLTAGLRTGLQTASATGMFRGRTSGAGG